MIPELALFDELHNMSNCDDLRHCAKVLVGLFPEKAEKLIAERQVWVSELLGRIEPNLYGRRIK